MGHRAAIYTVSVHPQYHPDKGRLLGDIDEQGTYLADALHSIFNPPGFSVTSADNSRTAACERCVVAGDEVRATFVHGQSGVAADIVNANGQLRLHQELDDAQMVRCGSLFRLPRPDKLGFWAVHVNNNRSAKGLISSELLPRFRSRFEKLSLLIQPCVSRDALVAAVEQDQLETVRLIRLERPHDRASAATDKWVATNESARLELAIAAAGRGSRLIGDLIKRYLHGDASAFAQIIQFQGLTFDEAKVEVTLANGNQRTFNIEKPEAGAAFTVELTDLDYAATGEPTADSVFAGLRGALDDLD
jgi:hypothetical protein